MKRSIGKKLSVVGKNFTKETGELIDNFTKNTNRIAGNISKAVSRIDVDRAKKDFTRSTRIAMKKGNRMVNRGMRKFRKTGFYKTMGNVPAYTSRFSLWSLVQFRKFRKTIRKGYYSSQKWILKKYPKIESWIVRRGNSVKSWVAIQIPLAGNFIQENYPRVENFVLTKLPVYRAVLGR